MTGNFSRYEKVKNRSERDDGRGGTFEGGTMRIQSPVFENGATIPDRFGCRGENINPPLTIENIPAGTQSLALIIEDPDASPGTFTHWVMYDIPATGTIEERSAPGREGMNSGGGKGYTGPCPPSGTHRYLFRIYALDTRSNLAEGSDRATLEKAMQGHILASAELKGLFSAPSRSPVGR
jgi:Raf kinase inhibitor-like YbhB/YbcL family protein